MLSLAVGSSSRQAIAVSLDHLVKYHPFGPNPLLKQIKDVEQWRPCKGSGFLEPCFSLNSTESRD